MMLAKHSSLLRKQSAKHAARSMASLAHPHFDSHHQPHRHNNSNNHSFPLLASPETALGYAHFSEVLDRPRMDQLKGRQSDSTDSFFSHNREADDLSFSEALLQSVSLSPSPESALGAIHSAEMLDGPLKSHLQGDPMGSYLSHNPCSSYNSSELETMLQVALLSSRPESALGVVHFGEMLDGVRKSQLEERQTDSMASYLQDNQHARSSESETAMLQSLLLSTSPESALGVVHFGEMLDGSFKSQLDPPQLRIYIAVKTLSPDQTRWRQC
jgi:hypothetical protein